MKTLIAGFGSIGRRHLRNLRALGETDFVLYRSHHSTLPEDEIAGIPVETDLQAALAYRPNAVIIANPTSLHLDVAVPAAEAGCHILVEKPVSDTTRRIGELKDALRRGGGKLLVGFQFRFHPGLQSVGKLIRKRAMGRPLSLRVDWGEYLPNWHPWEDYRQSYSARADLGGGVALTLNHPLDYLRWLFGEVESLWGFSGKVSSLELEVDDIAEIGLRFASGLVASVHLDYYRQPAVHRFEVVGEKGILNWDNADGAARLYDAATCQLDTVFPPEGFERNWLFMDEMRHFLAVVRGEQEPVCTLEDGIRAQQLALAIHIASRERRVLSANEIYAISN
jgi:predicted dehydrogenase